MTNITLVIRIHMVLMPPLTSRLNASITDRSMFTSVLDSLCYIYYRRLVCVKVGLRVYTYVMYQ